MFSGRLGRNHGIARPRDLGWFDCETIAAPLAGEVGERHRLFSGCLMRGRLEGEGAATHLTCQRSFTFHSAEQFWQQLFESAHKGKLHWIFAHNLAFDLIAVDIFKAIRDNHVKLTFPGAFRNPKPGMRPYEGLLLIDDPPTAICVEGPAHSRFLFVDTMNYFRCAVKDLGEKVELPKLPMPGKGAPAWEWERYCRRDVEIIKRVTVKLLTWWNAEQLGNFKPTAPGLAMNAYRHRFMEHKVDFDDDPEIRKLERACYYGGQTEAFYVGKVDQKCYLLDAASLYPAVMLEGRFPVRILRSEQAEQWKGGTLPFEPWASCAEVMLDTPDDTFPLRNERGLFFVRGKGATTLCGAELHYAWKRGYITAYRSWAQYILRPMFTRFVEYFWQLKTQYEEAGNAIDREFVKLMLNSLYGKFGQRGGKWHIDPKLYPSYEFEQFFQLPLIGDKPIRCLCLYDTVLRFDDTREPPKSAPAISGFVTAAGREKMRRYRQLAGPGNVYYQATDSLIVNQAGFDALSANECIAPNTLGKLRTVAAGETTEIIDLHRYRIGAIRKTGSVALRAREVGPNTFEQLQFDGLEAAITRGGCPSIRIRPVVRRLSATYGKGIVTSNGWVNPFTFETVPGLVANPEAV